MRFNINLEELERKRKLEEEKDFTIPYYELLDPDKADEREKQVEFLKSNEVILTMGWYPSDTDYEIFVGCMEIYKNTGVNYFNNFEKLFIHREYKTLNKGISNYTNASMGMGYPMDETSIEYLNSYKKEVLEAIKLMKFFGIESLYDTTEEQYIEYYNNAESEWHELIKEKLSKRKAKAEASAEKMKSNYFNFDNFDNDKFNKIFKDCIKDMDMGKNLYTLDEVININVNLDANKTFIVFLRKDDKVCFIGRTTNLLNYIGSKSKEYDADRVAFYPVDNDYIDDIYIRSLIQFDIPTGQVRNTNRKYISLTSAKRIFKELYKINLTHIKKIIAKYDLERFMIGDTIVLDKIELHKAVNDYLNLKQVVSP
jgi:hypothetical protein